MTTNQAKISRMVLDPAHLRSGENVPLFPDDKTVGRAVTRVQVQEFNIGLTANEVLAIYTLPFFETPIGYRWGDGALNLMPNAMTASSVNPAMWMKDNKISAFRTVSKSTTIRNISPAQLQGGVANCGRLQPCISNSASCPSGYNILGATSDNASAINIRLVQGLPGSMLEVSAIPGYFTCAASEGAYLVNKVLNENWTERDDYTNKACDTTVAPAATDANSCLAYTDVAAAEGNNTDKGTFATYANPGSGFVAGARAMVSGPDNTDITVFCTTAPAGSPQTYSVRVVTVYEFLPRLGSPLAMYELKDRSPEVEFLRKVRVFAATQVGLYPASYNDFSAVFNTFKRWLGKTADFYKSNRGLIRPAVNLIPGAAPIMDVVDRIV